MTYAEMTTKLETLNTYETMIADLKRQADTIRESIKAEMIAQDTEVMYVDKYTVRFTDVLSQRFDSTAFKKALPEVYKSFIKQIPSRRFTISV